VRKADEFDMAEDAQILGRVRPLLAEVFCSGNGYRGALLSDVSLPKLYARERLWEPWKVLHHGDYLVGDHHGKLISSFYE